MVSIKTWFRDLRSRRHRGVQRQQNTYRDEKSHAREDKNQISVILCDERPAIDPLIAAQTHNIKNCRLTRLPEELLLCILNHVGDDAVTLRCLRRVSRTFRRLIYDDGLWERVKAPHWCRVSDFMTETTGNLSEDEQKLLKRHLQTDGMCRECSLWCDVAVRGRLRWIMQAMSLDTIDPMSRYECKFLSRTGRRLKCHGCGTRQNIQTFSGSEQGPSKENRRCLGRQGAVQLCEHVHVSWADIENHINEWERRMPREWRAEDWSACLDHFNIECRDPSHDKRCTAAENPTWPRASLRTGTYDRTVVVLSLEWSPHSGIDVFTQNADGQARTPDVRELFREYRQGTGGILFPSHPANPLPEMACFHSAKCRCLYYETGGSKMADDKKRSRNDILPNGLCTNVSWLAQFDNLHRTYRGSHDLWTEEVRIGKHSPTARNSSCLITTYERQFLLFKKADRGTKRMNPGHAWFHAMDPDTYPRPASLQLPLCRRKDCINYFRRPKAFQCGCLSIYFHQ